MRKGGTWKLQFKNHAGEVTLFFYHNNLAVTELEVGGGGGTGSECSGMFSGWFQNSPRQLLCHFTPEMEKKKAAINRRVSRRLSASTVIRHPAGETKLSIERLSMRRGHFHREPSHRSAVGPGQRRS